MSYRDLRSVAYKKAEAALGSERQNPFKGALEQRVLSHDDVKFIFFVTEAYVYYKPAAGTKRDERLSTEPLPDPMEQSFALIARLRHETVGKIKAHYVQVQERWSDYCKNVKRNAA